LYAYVDETGNTGARLLDDEQPLFVTAALMTRSDFDSRFADDIRKIANSLDAEEIHANKLGIGRLEPIALDILRTVRKSDPSFFLARVEKRYVIASKVFDTIFDSYENKAVPWHVFNVRPLRLIMVFKIASLLDDGIANQFWEALMEANSERAREKMAEFCRTLAHRVSLVPDERSREIISQSLDWAAQNPESLDFVHQTKAGRKSHLPNMVGFGNLLSGIERQSNVWGFPVEVIRHDRQQEFAQSIEFWHKMYSNALPDVVELPLGEKVVLQKVFGSKLEIVSAKDSAGIQIIDVILWLFGRSLRGDNLPKNCQALMDYVFSRAYQDDFSFSGVGAAAGELIEDIENVELPAEAFEKAKALQDELEQKRQDGMSAYAKSKRGE